MAKVYARRAVPGRIHVLPNLRSSAGQNANRTGLSDQIAAPIRAYPLLEIQVPLPLDSRPRGQCAARVT
jgi:hypothetical protein